MKLPEIRKLERLLIASGIPHRTINFKEGCKITYRSQPTGEAVCITAVEYALSRGLELANEKRKYSTLNADDVFRIIKEQHERV